MRDDSGEIHWRSKRHADPRHRKWERWALKVLYFALAFSGLMLGYFAIVAKGGLLASWVMWLYVVLLVGTAFFCLARHETLAMAEHSMTRWLRPPTDAEGNTDGIVLLKSLSDLLPGEASSEQHPLPSSTP